MEEQYNGPVMTGNYNTGSPDVQAPVPEKKSGFAIASLVLGILSLIGFCCCGITVITAPLALIFGIISLAKKRSGTGMAIAGIVMAVLSILMIGVMIFSVKDFLPYSEEIVQDYTHVIAEQDEVFPEYEKDGTLPPYIAKYKESPYKELLDKYGITVEMVMDALDQQYKTGQLPKPESVAGSAGYARPYHENDDTEQDEAELNPAI
ncbi:MAG: DUF4190 domain-containing protein [Oscillospiraceae bacterium]|nr:DUF4190 domain-containing protein [Oscillospiraceae bacterium]